MAGFGSPYLTKSMETSNMSVPYRFVNLEDVQVDPALPLFCDTETIGLYGEIRLLQMYQESWPEVLFVEYPDPLSLYVFLVQHYTVWHNAHYDLTTIQANSNMAFEFKNYDDTFLASRLAMPQYESYSLDDVMTVCCGFDPYINNGLKKKDLQKSKWNVDSLTEAQLQYAATDVYYMPNVWSKVKEAVDTRSYKLDKLVLAKALKFQWNGMPVDEQRVNSMYAKADQELAKLACPINANSWQQVRSWLDVEESNKQYLSRLALVENNTRARTVLETRKWLKLQSFLRKYDNNEGLVVGKFKPSARSGRFTSDDENLQQIPRALKCVFGYDEDADRVLIYADYAQLELRTICAILKVSLMEDLFRSGEDLHGYVAERIFGKDWTKEDRQVTKTYNFNLLYGGSVGMVISILITYGMFIEERLASKHKAMWLRLFPEINGWQQECIAKWRKGKLNSTPFGRQYKAKLMTDFMNIMNQGAGAEVAKLAIHYLDLPEEVDLNNFVHDSFILSCPNDPAIYEPAALQLATAMQEAWFEMSKCFKIKDLPMPVNVKVGKNWGDLEEGKNVLYELDLEPYATLEKVNAKV